MRRRTPLLLAAPLAALPLLGADAVNPGVVFEITTTHHDQTPPRTEVGRVQIEGANLAMAIEGPDGGGRLIYRGEAGEMVMESPAEGTYTVIDEATLERLSGQINAAMAEMERMLENLPEEQRAMVRQMQERGGMPGMPGMGAMELPEVETRPTGRSETRNGYPVDEWEVLEDGEVVRRMWVTPWGEIDGGDEARQAMLGMVEFFDAFLEAMPPMPGGGPMIRNPFRNMDVTGGMPVWTAEIAADGSVERESELTSVERTTLPVSTFEPDPSLTERPLPDMGG
ncbi:MAG: hypothetical protein RLN75_08720 [Longimicrobiales bacterium]